MTQHFAVPVGEIRLVIYDIRVDSESYKKLQVIEVGEDNYCLAGTALQRSVATGDVGDGG